MRFMLGTQSDPQQKTFSAMEAARARHRAFIAAYLDRLDSLDAPDASERNVTVVSRSATSPVMTALSEAAGRLAGHGCTVRVIFGHTEPRPELHETLCALAPMIGPANEMNAVRHARARMLKDAHEQLTLGTTQAWSGDAMNRAEGKRDVMDLFEHDAPKMARFGQLSFEALWTASDALARSALRAAGRPADASLRPAGQMASASFAHPFDGAGLTRH